MDGEEEEWGKTEASRGIAALGSFLVVTDTLTHLDLAHNAMGADLFYLLCEGLSQNVSLRYLDISSNRLGPDAGAPLGQLLASSASALLGAHTPPLQTCLCASNTLGDHGARYLPVPPLEECVCVCVCMCVCVCVCVCVCSWRTALPLSPKPQT